MRGGRAAVKRGQNLNPSPSPTRSGEPEYARPHEAPGCVSPARAGGLCGGTPVGAASAASHPGGQAQTDAARNSQTQPGAPIAASDLARRFPLFPHSLVFLEYLFYTPSHGDALRAW
jgi:hypothetical protein